MEDNKITFSKLKELDSNSFIEIMKNVINYEEKIDNNSKKITFIDSGMLHYALDFDMTENSKINEMICNELDRAIIFVCDNNISIEQDEIRPNNQELNLKKSQSMIIDYLKKKIYHSLF